MARIMFITLMPKLSRFKPTHGETDDCLEFLLWLLTMTRVIWSTCLGCLSSPILNADLGFVCFLRADLSDVSGPP